jgi:5-oxoprolinase (ATP-hydrolysing)
VVLHRFCLRHGSGGAGLYRGGDGVIREVSCLPLAALFLLHLPLPRSSTDRAGDFGLRGPGINPGGDTVGPMKGGTRG